jgi:hypothetical protein
MYTGPADEDKGRVPHLPRNLNGTIVEMDHGGVSMENISTIVPKVGVRLA